MPRRRHQTYEQRIFRQQSGQPRHGNRDQPVTQIGGQGRHKQQPEVSVHPKTRAHSATFRAQLDIVNQMQPRIVAQKP
jgi:hypothetical protein